MAKLVKINNNYYSLGFAWELMTGFNILENQTEFDAYVLYKNQVGLIHTHREQLFLKSLPLITALNLNYSSFIGIFTLKDNRGEVFYSLMAIHEDSIIGFGDAIYLSKQEAEEGLLEIEELFTQPFEKKIIIDNYDESIDFIIDHLNNKSFRMKQKVRSLTHRNGNIKILALTLLLMSIPFGYITLSEYFEYKKQKKREEAHIVFLQEKEERRLDLQSNITNIFPQNWLKKPFPYETYRLYAKKLLTLPTIEKGWSLSKVHCRNSTIYSTWKHEIQASYEDLPFNGRLYSPQEVHATHQIESIPLRTIDISYTELLKKEHAEKALYQTIQNIGALIRIGFNPPEVKEDKDLELSMTSPWQQGLFTLSNISNALILDESLFKKLATIPSLYITEIQYQDNTWSIKGEFYVAI